MTTKTEIRKEFVKQALQEHGELMLDAFEGDIMRLKLLKSEQLLNSLSFNVRSNSSMDGELSIKLAVHGRFQDMGAGRMAKIESSDNNRRLVKGVRKAEKWYAHNVFGLLNTLIGTLSYGLTQEVKQRIVSNLESK